MHYLVLKLLKTVDYPVDTKNKTLRYDILNFFSDM